MPPVSDHPSLQLRLLPNEFYVMKYETKPDIWNALLRKLLRESVSSSPAQSRQPDFLSFTRTEEEISIVGECTPASDQKEGDWRCIKIAGPMDFGESF